MRRLEDVPRLQDEEVRSTEEDQAERELRRARRIVLAEVQPEPREDRREDDDAERFDRLEPARREREAEQRELRRAVGKKIESRSRLLVSRPENRREEE